MTGPAPPAGISHTMALMRYLMTPTVSRFSPTRSASSSSTPVLCARARAFGSHLSSQQTGS